VLRIEDTDQVRSKSEYEDEILESMRWLGMEWDELYRQSERFELYREYAHKLVDSGLAYHEGPAILLKVPHEDIKLYDLIRGEISFDSALIKDQVLLKSDGSPAYSFACVVDDALMGITCVIRGDDHISNTPKQLLIYKALGFKPPKYAHLPLIMGDDGSRLSKRTGAVAVTEYRTMGFLPEAMMNYLLLLGWAPGNNQEVMSLKNVIKNFTIKKINKSAAVFSMEKLKWMNKQYIKQQDPERLTDLLYQRLLECSLITEDFSKAALKRIAVLYQSRMDTLNEFIERTRYFYVDRLDTP
jgi:glutamyl-tRNA synthetase